MGGKRYFLLGGIMHLGWCMGAVCQVMHLSPAAYPSSGAVNYVRSWEVVCAEALPGNIGAATGVERARMTTQYVDGLGRPLETVVKQGSLQTQGSAGSDLVIAVEYDEWGREQFKYLPFGSMATGAGRTDGSFKTDPFVQQALFYNSPGGVVEGQGEKIYYSESNFEPPPLGRLTRGMAAGNSWAGAGRGVSKKYWYNKARDSVRLWNVLEGQGVGTFGSYVSPSAYGAGELFKEATVDEMGRQVIEYRDKEEKTVLRKVQLGAVSDPGGGSGHTGWLCTYYIYDNLNNLRCVVQPRGVEQISGSWSLSDPQVLSELCFRYEYDSRRRMIMKKVPGSGAVNMVYDARDRLVMSQDAAMAVGQPVSKWMVTLYDGLNRPVQTGLLQSNYNNKTFVQHLADASVSVAYPFSETATPGSPYWEKLTVTHYDNYSGVPSAVGSSLNTTYITAANFITSYNTSPEFARAVVQSPAVRGLVTWSQAKVLGTASQFITQVNFYDDKSRVIQVQRENQTGGVDITTTQYDFQGKVLRVHEVHRRTAAGQYELSTKNSYDVIGRITRIEKSFNNEGYRVIASMEYDGVGQLKKKRLGSSPEIAGQALETLSYEYNVRGWLLGVNREFIKDASGSNYFGFEVGYDKSGVLGSYVPQYGGNIGGTLWKSRGDNQKRKYDFTYDGAGRLTGAGFTQYVSGSGATAVFDKSAGVDFSVSGVSYDANGNIASMSQSGLGVSRSSVIDQLSYTYRPGSNKLQSVRDGMNDTAGVLGDFKTSGLHPQFSAKALATTPALRSAITDYNYDVNGNLTRDLNKDLAGVGGSDGIAYNYLNLPSVITVRKDASSLRGTITYVYDALGNRLEKITREYSVGVMYKGVSEVSDITTTTRYISGFVYQSRAYSNPALSGLQYTDKLQYALHEEGRIRQKGDGTAAVYDYFIKDQLGNVRMVLTEEKQVDIYPAATLEPSKVGTEELYYDIRASQIADRSTVVGLSSYTNNNGIANPPVNGSFDNMASTKVYKLNSATQKLGLGITLKVMSGDRLDIYGKSYYFQSNTGGTASNSALTPLNILAGLLGGPSGPPGTDIHGEVTAGALNAVASGVSVIKGMLGLQSAQSDAFPGKPRAFINYILFDEQFKSTGSGFAGVGESGVLTDYSSTPGLHNIEVSRNGFVYIYCSNESPVDVFFDNIQVVHSRGAIEEETHYYPFGLTMAAISSRAAGGLENKLKFVSQELDDDLGLNWYQFKFRNHDPQIGRFLQIDPLASKYVYNSTYAYAENKPTSGIDLEGLEFWSMVFNVITDPANAPSHISNYVAQKKSDYSESVNATARLSTETSGEVNHPGSNPVEKSLTKTFGTMQDINSAARPVSDVLETTSNLASLTPVGEAGVTTEACFGMKTVVAETVVADATVVSKSKPNFIVDQGGQVFPVPKNAEGPVPVINKNGNVTGTAFTGGKSGANGNVTSVRIMNPNLKNPNGYVKYYNDAQPKQGLNPYTGRTLPNTENHFPLLNLP